jgi:hypothetical protein
MSASDTQTPRIKVESSLVVLTHPEAVKMIQTIAGADMEAIDGEKGVAVWKKGVSQSKEDRNLDTFILTFSKPVSIDSFNVKLKASRLVYSIREVELADGKTVAEIKAAKAAALKSPPSGKAVLPAKVPTGQSYPKVPGKVIDVDSLDYKGPTAPGVYSIMQDAEGDTFADFTVAPKTGAYKKKRVYGSEAQIQKAVQEASQGVTIKKLEAAEKEVTGQISTLSSKRGELQSAADAAAEKIRAAKNSQETASLTRRLKRIDAMVEEVSQKEKQKQELLRKILQRKETLGTA